MPQVIFLGGFIAHIHEAGEFKASKELQIPACQILAHLGEVSRWRHMRIHSPEAILSIRRTDTDTNHTNIDANSTCTRTWANPSPSMSFSTSSTSSLSRASVKKPLLPLTPDYGPDDDDDDGNVNENRPYATPETNA
jgi:hypothetical protein